MPVSGGNYRRARELMGPSGFTRGNWGEIYCEHSRAGLFCDVKQELKALLDPEFSIDTLSRNIWMIKSKKLVTYGLWLLNS